MYKADIGQQERVGSMGELCAIKGGETAVEGMRRPRGVGRDILSFGLVRRGWGLRLRYGELLLHVPVHRFVDDRGKPLEGIVFYKGEGLHHDLKQHFVEKLLHRLWISLVNSV